MGKVVPDAIEHYLASLNQLGDALLEEIHKDGRAQQLPLIDAETGAFLRVLATAIGARRILEIGTSIGYSGIWLARAMPPDGMLISIEVDPRLAATARANFARSDAAARAHVMVGDAPRVLHKLAGPFDFIFQDADKLQYESLHDPLVALLRPGGILAIDNVLWDGEVVPGYVSPPIRDAETTNAIAAYNRRLAADPRLHTTIVPLRDGVAVSVKTQGLETEHRSLPELQQLLETLAHATQMLRSADWNDVASAESSA